MAIDGIAFCDIPEFDKGWVVGMLDGEGTFDAVKKKYPRIRLEMTDKDCVDRFREILGVTRIARLTKRGKYKDSWTCSIHSDQAKLLMLDVYPFMSERRQQRIQEILLYG